MRRTKWNALAFLFSGALILAACGQQPGASESAGEEPASQEPAASGEEPTGGEFADTITMAEPWPYCLEAGPRACRDQMESSDLDKQALDSNI